MERPRKHCFFKNDINVTLHSPGQKLCPINWLPFQDSCYLFNVHNAQAASWDNAKKACTAFKGAELISILSPQEQLYIEKRLKDMKVTNDIWIGLNDRKSEGLYTWTDRSVVSYKNWAYMEPSNGFLAAYKNCVTLNANSGTWETSYCSWHKGYVCKQKNGEENTELYL